MFLAKNITTPTNGAVMTGEEAVVKVLFESKDWVGIADAIVFAEKKTQ